MPRIEDKKDVAPVGYELALDTNIPHAHWKVWVPHRKNGKEHETEGFWAPAENFSKGKPYPHPVARPRTPEVGLACTISVGSDSYPGTIIEVSPSKHQIKIQRDRCTATKDSDFYSNQNYVFQIDPNGEVILATRRKNGLYAVAGQRSFIFIGERRAYMDPSF
jgi:hypothetical protein